MKVVLVYKCDLLMQRKNKQNYTENDEYGKTAIIIFFFFFNFNFFLFLFHERITKIIKRRNNERKTRRYKQNLFCLFCDNMALCNSFEPF